MAEQQRQREGEGAPSHQAAKAVGAAVAGGSMLVLSGLVLAGTVVGLALATPVLVVFSPVLVPAAAAALLAAGGLASSLAMAVVAMSILSWVYGFVAGKHPPGADQLEHARLRLAGKARDVKERLGHRLEQAQPHHA
ncbi:oleosin 16 kDa-like [Wolffia australiana]